MERNAEYEGSDEGIRCAECRAFIVERQRLNLTLWRCLGCGLDTWLLWLWPRGGLMARNCDGVWQVGRFRHKGAMR